VTRPSNRTWTDKKTDITHRQTIGYYYTMCGAEVPSDPSGLRQTIGYYFTMCGAEVPSDPSGRMPGWPSPAETDTPAKFITCFECIVMEET
jgi:hypothetical protein